TGPEGGAGAPPRAVTHPGGAQPVSISPPRCSSGLVLAVLTQRGLGAGAVALASQPPWPDLSGDAAAHRACTAGGSSGELPGGVDATLCDVLGVLLEPVAHIPCSLAPAPSFEIRVIAVDLEPSAELGDVVDDEVAGADHGPRGGRLEQTFRIGDRDGRVGAIQQLRRVRGDLRQ